MATPTIAGAFTDLNKKVSTSAESLNTQIAAALDKDDLDPMQMLQLQFQMGKFNAMVEATSSVTKGLTDTAKTLAQRAGG
ncbi:MAG: EscF/YscF/HrpA family type III secretion system needle major subunit [Desulfobacterium sp.]|jgi:type III secretion protein F|nr:EscF/YscF/HrpA family type III secretion system needle major subunit [Desulfobacterium sp.]